MSAKMGFSMCREVRPSGVVIGEEERWEGWKGSAQGGTYGIAWVPQRLPSQMFHIS
jgi:hypothetical protein